MLQLVATPSPEGSLGHFEPTTGKASIGALALSSSLPDIDACLIALVDNFRILFYIPFYCIIIILFECLNWRSDNIHSSVITEKIFQFVHASDDCITNILI